MKAPSTKLFVVFIIIMISIVACDACTRLNNKVGLQDDNFIEECVEALIENKTGLDVDLSPESPE